MRMFEIWDGGRYLFTVMPSEEPRDVLREEHKRHNRLHMVIVENGQREAVSIGEVAEAISFEEEDYADGN